MKIAIDIGHPAQVHFFKNFIWEMERKGHQIFISASDKDVTTDLLEAYGFSFFNMGSYGNTMLKKIFRVPGKSLSLFRALRPFAPDFFLGLGSVHAAHVSWMMKKPCVVFEDDEYTYPYYHWFTDTVCGFSGFKLTGKKIIKVPGYKELAYLHPNWFKPEPLLVSRERIVVLRFVSWTAFHDVGKHGFSLEHKTRLCQELSKYARIFISSESHLPCKLERYRLVIKPEEIHNFLSGADLLVCDSQTMTTEGALLGIPVVRCNSFVGEKDMGNFKQLEKRYDLIFNYSDPEAAIKKAVELIQIPGLKKIWHQKRQHLLTETVDVTALMIWMVETYPKSIDKLKSSVPVNPDLDAGGIASKEWFLANG